MRASPPTPSGPPPATDSESTPDSKRQWKLLVGCMPALQAYVRRAVGSHDVANDVVQEVSIRVLTGDGPCEPERFLAWSRGIARHVIALGWRMRQRAFQNWRVSSRAGEKLRFPRGSRILLVITRPYV